MSFVEFHDVKKTYHMGEVEIPALSILKSKKANSA